MTVCGKVVVSTSYDQGKIFTGVGPFGWTRKFDWASVTHIRKNTSFNNHNGVQAVQWAITMLGDKQTRINLGYNENQRSVTSSVASVPDTTPLNAFQRKAFHLPN